MKVSGNRVLVVDDDDAIRLMVERILRHEHFEVETARDGFEAIEKLAKFDYSAVLLDLMMPRVDGTGVLQFLQRTQPDSSPPVILMTADAEGGEKASRSRGVCGLLSKPFDIRQLLAQLRLSGQTSAPAPC